MRYPKEDLNTKENSLKKAIICFFGKVPIEMPKHKVKPSKENGFWKTDVFFIKRRKNPLITSSSSIEKQCCMTFFFV